MKRVRIVISGEVQGVFFRKSALAKALELGVTGWIKNSANGHVIAEVQGENQRVETFITWCYQGPEKAVVTGVESNLIPLEDGIETFNIHYG
jgi:acylphosphatase